jgi:hypothetical protein|tara:strand:- start:9395 stop:9670 length:276 start_codon:yes stop_codon:yes gene_type:complete
MTIKTTEPIEYNALALKGVDIKDQEYVAMYNLDPKVANTPEINERMLDIVEKDNIKSGVDPKRVKELRLNAEKDIKILLAKKGLLPNKRIS